MERIFETNAREDPLRLVREISAAAREAGAIMTSAVRIQDGVKDKEGHGNYVTQYDKRVQTHLRSRLSRILPEAAFVGEEDDAGEFSSSYKKGYAFVVDPIDGTSNFIFEYRPSVTSIALLKDGVPYLAVVYNPYEDLLYTAIKGRGSYCNGRQLHSSTKLLTDSLVLFGTAAYYEDVFEETMYAAREYLKRSVDLRRSGCAAWDLCCMAEGKAGLYFEMRIQVWDFAAGALIAEEAGCLFMDMYGRRITYDGPSSVLCVSQGVAKEGRFLLNL